MTADPDRIHQLLMILLDNAIRHTLPGGRIRVAVAATRDGQARVAVRDEGEGIAAEHLPHIFDRFYRADGARGRSSGGTGLGLAIAQAIVRAHDGDITVSSAPGRGTTFVATIAHALVSPPALPEQSLAPAADAAAGAPAYRRKIQTRLSTVTNPTMASGRSNPMTDDLLNPRP
jgi:hypothetical protein